MRRQPSLDTQPVRCGYAARPADRPNCQLTAVVAYGDMALCADCAERRSTVGKATAPRPLRPGHPLDVLAWVAHADDQLHQARAELTAAVTRARTQGQPWSSIASTLDITRQAAQQRFNKIKSGEG